MGIISETELQLYAQKAMRRCIQSGQIAERKKRALKRTMFPEKLKVRRVPHKFASEELKRLAKALRAERQLGLGGHWAYDLNRHIALARAYNFELDRLR